ncbi:hypothetical protein CRENBAI_006843 [Crenichthys baileyi]|uniref:Uncharacterized protein n=1 Tax=Crenichthys baileyi TaxID=28760 RepID=A0AAV9S8V5_9TELE
MGWRSSTPKYLCYGVLTKIHTERLTSRPWVEVSLSVCISPPSNQRQIQMCLQSIVLRGFAFKDLQAWIPRSSAELRLQSSSRVCPSTSSQLRASGISPGSDLDASQLAQLVCLTHSCLLWKSAFGNRKPPGQTSPGSPCLHSGSCRRTAWPILCGSVSVHRSSRAPGFHFLCNSNHSTLIHHIYGFSSGLCSSAHPAYPGDSR